MTRTVLILNKKHSMREDLETAVKQVRSEGYDLEVQIPWGFEDVAKLFDVSLSAGADRIVAAGGDGTLNGMTNLIVSREVQSDIELSLLPLGTANDFARGADIPVNDPASALRLACSGASEPIDVGEVNGRCFVNVASGGIGAEITSTTPTELKRMLGGAAYSIMGLIKATQLTP